MTSSFPGQLTTHGLHASFGGTWNGGIVVPFYLKVFFTIKIRSFGIFKAVSA